MVLDRLAKARAQAEVWAEAVGQVQAVEAGGAAEGLLWAQVVTVCAPVAARQLRTRVPHLATR